MHHSFIHSFIRVRFGLSARARPLASRMNEMREWECSVLRDVHIVLDTNKMYSKQRDYLFSVNLNLDLLTLARENVYFNTLDLEKVQGKRVGCIKSRGDTSPAYCTPTLQGATAEGWKSRGSPTPALGSSQSSSATKVGEQRQLASQIRQTCEDEVYTEVYPDVTPLRFL